MNYDLLGPKCIVKGCANHMSQGVFVGVLCAPCHKMLTTGIVRHGRTFIHDLAKSAEEADRCVDTLLRS